MKRLLLTGASGFIGRHTLAPLNASGYDVHAVSSRPGDAVQKPSGAATWHQVDLLDDAAVQKLLDRIRPTHLLHCAWLPVSGQYASSPANADWLRASLNLVRRFAESGGQHAAVTGTCFEYDWSFGWCRESTPLVPATLYGDTKAELEARALAYAREAGLTLAWCRVFLLYGPHEHPTRLVASVVSALLQGKEARCSHGNQIRDFLYVQDTADALVATLDAGLNGPVNVGSGQPLQVRTVIERAAQLVGRPDLVRLGALPVPEGDPPLVVADVRRLIRETGWHPRFDLDRGLHQTIDWWRRAICTT